MCGVRSRRLHIFFSTRSITGESNTLFPVDLLRCSHVNMTGDIDSPAKCELEAAIRFLQAEKNSAARIHRRMSGVYGGSFTYE